MELQWVSNTVYVHALELSLSHSPSLFPILVLWSAESVESYKNKFSVLPLFGLRSSETGPAVTSDHTVSPVHKLTMTSEPRQSELWQWFIPWTTLHFAKAIFNFVAFALASQKIRIWTTVKQNEWTLENHWISHLYFYWFDVRIYIYIIL